MNIENLMAEGACLLCISVMVNPYQGEKRVKAVIVGVELRTV